MSKRELRNAVLAARKALAAEEHHDKSARICKRIELLEVWRCAKAILFFLPFRNEVNIEPLIDLAWMQGKRVFAPRCVKEGHQLQVVEIESREQLEESDYGIREPVLTSNEEDPKELDLVLVPGSVFDSCGGRMGYGAGYYDRFLLRCRPDTIRLAPHFQLQLVERLHQEPWDQPMDILVSEEQTLFLSRTCINGSGDGKID